MSFSDNTFAFVIFSYVFADPVKSLREIRRVEKHDGQILMLERMRSDNVFVGEMLDFMNPIFVYIMGENI